MPCPFRAGALAVGAGHSFAIPLREGFPVNVLNPLKAVPEVCTIFCATANPVDVLVAVTNRGRGIIGVIDGSPRPESSRIPTSPTGAACCAPSATSSDDRAAISLASRVGTCGGTSRRTCTGIADRG